MCMGKGRRKILSIEEGRVLSEGKVEKYDYIDGGIIVKRYILFVLKLILWGSGIVCVVAFCAAFISSEPYAIQTHKGLFHISAALVGSCALFCQCLERNSLKLSFFEGFCLFLLFLYWSDGLNMLKYR